MRLSRLNKNNNKPVRKQILNLVPRWLITSDTIPKKCVKYFFYF